MSRFEISIACFMLLFLFSCTSYYADRRVSNISRQNAYEESLIRIQEIEANNRDRRCRPLLNTTRFYLGVPYRAGGDSRRGMDCSGFVTRVFQECYQLELPHNASQIYLKCQKISKTDLILGDLVFFSNQSRKKVTHVGIYLGNNYFVHASESYGVTISGLTGKAYRSSFFGTGRIMKWENDFSDTTQNSSN